MVEAATAMDRALETVAVHCRELGIPIEVGLDPNGTCLIGPEHTELFTSLGQLEAKRTTTTPDMAGLLAHLLDEAGVGEGDRVAVGASGSFPALLVATLTAVEALGAEPVTILSLGASSFGATRPGFHLLDLYELLEAGGFVSVPPAAVSLGGSEDVGSEFDPVFRAEPPGRASGEGRAGSPEPGAAGERRRTNGPLRVCGRLREYRRCRGEPGHQPPDPERAPGAGEGGGRTPADRLRPRSPPRMSGASSSRWPPGGFRSSTFSTCVGWPSGMAFPGIPSPFPLPARPHFRDARKGNGLLFWLLTVGYLGALAVVAFAGREEGGPETVR